MLLLTTYNKHLVLYCSSYGPEILGEAKPFRMIDLLRMFRHHVRLLTSLYNKRCTRRYHDSLKQEATLETLEVRKHISYMRPSGYNKTLIRYSTTIYNLAGTQPGHFRFLRLVFLALAILVHSSPHKPKRSKLETLLNPINKQVQHEASSYHSSVSLRCCQG